MISKYSGHQLEARKLKQKKRLIKSMPSREYFISAVDPSWKIETNISAKGLPYYFGSLYIF
jgi:hypothetical protein